jgi:hypothetical protein
MSFRSFLIGSSTFMTLDYMLVIRTFYIKQTILVAVKNLEAF